MRPDNNRIDYKIIEYKMRNIFLEISYGKCGAKASLGHL